jgi:hypothetical protein
VLVLVVVVVGWWDGNARHQARWENGGEKREVSGEGRESGQKKAERRGQRSEVRGKMQKGRNESFVIICKRWEFRGQSEMREARKHR